MLAQISYILSYLAPVLFICLYISILAFGYFSYTKTRHVYGKLLMTAGALTITTNIIFLALTYSNFLMNLINSGMDILTAFSIVETINIVYLISNIFSTLFIIAALYLIYIKHIAHYPNTTRETPPK